MRLLIVLFLGITTATTAPEWHTHPDGYGVAASGDDRELLERLSQVMAEDGLPEVMLIAGEHDKFAVHLKDHAAAF